MPLTVGESGHHLIMVLWAHPSQHPKRHLDRFSRFCRAHERYQQIYRHTHTHQRTHRPRYSVHSNKALSLITMRPNNVIGMSMLFPFPSHLHSEQHLYSHSCGNSIWDPWELNYSHSHAHHYYY